MRKLISLFCIIWLCANEATGCANNLKIKIIYAPATLQTVFSISPEYFDKGYINHSTDSVYVECDSLIYDFFNCIQALKVSDQNSRYNSIVKPYHTNVRGKVLLYKEDQVVKVYYIGQFLVLYNDTLYDIDEKLRKNIDSMIKKAEELICGIIRKLLINRLCMEQVYMTLKSATCNILDIWGCGSLSKTTRFRKESL